MNLKKAKEVVLYLLYPGNWISLLRQGLGRLILHADKRLRLVEGAILFCIISESFVVVAFLWYRSFWFVLPLGFFLWLVWFGREVLIAFTSGRPKVRRDVSKDKADSGPFTDDGTVIEFEGKRRAIALRRISVLKPAFNDEKWTAQATAAQSPGDLGETALTHSKRQQKYDKEFVAFPIDSSARNACISAKTKAKSGSDSDRSDNPLTCHPKSYIWVTMFLMIVTILLPFTVYVVTPALGATVQSSPLWQESSQVVNQIRSALGKEEPTTSPTHVPGQGNPSGKSSFSGKRNSSEQISTPTAVPSSEVVTPTPLPVNCQQPSCLINNILHQKQPSGDRGTGTDQRDQNTTTGQDQGFRCDYTRDVSGTPHSNPELIQSSTCPKSGKE